METAGSHPKKKEDLFQSILSEEYVLKEATLLIQLTYATEEQLAGAKRELDKIANNTALGIFQRCGADADKRRMMKKIAWNAAKDFWEEELKKPGLSSDTAAFGGTRLTEITSIIEELTKPPQNPVK